MGSSGLLVASLVRGSTRRVVSRPSRRLSSAQVIESFLIELTTAALLSSQKRQRGRGSGCRRYASAAQRADVVYTSDFDDLDRLGRVFPTVTVLRC